MIQTQVKNLFKKFERKYDTYNRIEISRTSLINNLNFFKQKTGKQVIPILKGNAYGHGIEQVAPSLKEQDVPYLAVDGYFEAIRARQYTNQPLLVMGMIKSQNFSRIITKKLAFVVQDEQTLHALGALNKKIKIHLEINTGMNRYGIKPDEIPKYLSNLKNYPKLNLEGVMTHLADPDGDDQSTIDTAVEIFDQAIELIFASGFDPKLLHVGQSAGSLRIKSKYANCVRVGLSLCGINPFSADHPMHQKFKDLKPAMRLISTISKVIELKKGDKVSYNYTFTAPKNMKIGILPLGYYEGIPRDLSNKDIVKVGSSFQPIVGRVCMNHTMISLERTKAKVGDEVVVISDQQSDKNSIDRLSAEHNLFAYSFLTSLSSDVRRTLV